MYFEEGGLCVLCDAFAEYAVPPTWVMRNRRKGLISALGFWLPEIFDLHPGIIKVAVYGEDGVFNPLTGDRGGGWCWWMIESMLLKCVGRSCRVG